jgi:DNA-binding transcriptional ArsR family regulator
VISFRLDDRDAAHVGFAVSPLLESVLSLHVLAEPGHHPLQHDFVRRMRRLPAPLKRAMAHFRFVYRWTVPDAFFPGPEGAASFERELAGLLSLGEETVLCDFGRPLYDHAGHREAAVYAQPEVRKTMLRRAAAWSRNGRAAASELLDDPTAFVRTFASMLQEYWHAAFAEEWERLEAPLVRAAEEARRELEARGVGALAELLRPHVRFDESSGRLRVDLPHEHELAIGPSRPLVLTPSAFVWPHVRVNCDDPWPVGFVFPAPFVRRQARPPVASAELLAVLRALADDTRLRALKLIAERPRSAQELAPLIGITEAGLTKQLRQLAQAGILTSRREGYYVVYALDPARLAALSEELLGFLAAERRAAS